MPVYTSKPAELMHMIRKHRMSALFLDIAIVNEPSLQRGQDERSMIPKRRQHVIDRKQKLRMW